MNQNQVKPSNPEQTPAPPDKDYVSMEEIETLRKKMEAEDDEAFRRAIDRKISHQSHTETDSMTDTGADTPADTEDTADASPAAEASGDEDTAIPFPDFPRRSEEDAAAAIFAALETATAAAEPAEPGETEPHRLFGDVNTAEYTPGDTDSEPEQTENKSDGEPVKQKKRRRWPWVVLACVLTVVIGYLTVAFIPSGPIANLRSIYIQTAMSTADHQWLATWLFPKSVIDRAWTDPNHRPDDAPDTFEGLETVGTGDVTLPAESGTESVIDPPTTDPAETKPVPEDTTAPDKTEPSKPKDDILGLASLKVGGTDYAGNKITVVDVEEGLFISEFTQKHHMVSIFKHHGYVMVIDDPSRVFVGSTPEKDTTGYRILDMMNYYGDVVAGINASGFSDPNDAGTGSDIIGACLSEGQFWGRYTTTMSSVVLTKENRLIVGWLPNWSSFTNIRDGMQFGPILVNKGKNVIDKETGGGWGTQPRTAIGQREDGAIILIVIDGRVSSSDGCTLWEMADMMVRYGAVTAGGCDGGSSVVMAYDGKVINDNSSANPKYGRRIPNAFLVRSKKADD